MLPNICNIYNIRHPTFHLPLVKHDFAEQRLDYQLIKLLNPQRSHLRHNLYSFMVLKPLSNITFLITMLIVVMMFIV